MKIIRHASQLPRYPASRLGFVPTMGAFHEGHLSLMRAARQECDKVIVSLFVNPLQFAESEDLRTYPRDEEADAEMARRTGVDVLFAPTVEDIYPRPSTIVNVPEVTQRWEGAARPGHFDGVATVVCKLFHMVAPHVSFFGLKDLQQCQVVRRMAEDLNMNLTLRLMPTLREDDGLAMSSRNRLLKPEERAAAPALYQELQKARQVALSRPDETAHAVNAGKRRLKKIGFSVDYFALVDLPDMNEIISPSGDCALIIAGRLGTIRLIDNILLSG